MFLLSGKLRVSFSGQCRRPVTDLEVHHALNYMTSGEVYNYFSNNVERIDETLKIREASIAQDICCVT